MAKHGDTIQDGGVLWRVVDKRLNGKIADIPDFFERSEMMKRSTTKTTLTTPEKLLVNLNGIGYIGGPQNISLIETNNWDSESQNMVTGTNRAGKDVYVYLVETSDQSLHFLLSTRKDHPSGYTVENSRKIGGFHCLCATVSVTGHAMNGNAGDIIPTSIWDPIHQPMGGNPEGMVYVEGIGKWVDIYLNSWDSTNNQLVSVYGGVTVDGGSSPKFHGEKFAELLGLIGKQLPTRDEFIAFAKGSNENTNINGNSDAGSAGGHIDTSSRRMISSDGIEDCCGFLWQWTRDFYQPQSGSWATTGVYNSSVDSQSYGQAYGTLYRFIVGGSWSDGTHAGSRATSSVTSDAVSAAYGGRGVAFSKPIL